MVRCFGQTMNHAKKNPFARPHTSEADVAIDGGEKLGPQACRGHKSSSIVSFSSLPQASYSCFFTQQWLLQSSLLDGCPHVLPHSATASSVQLLFHLNHREVMRPHVTLWQSRANAPVISGKCGPGDAPPGRPMQHRDWASGRTSAFTRVAWRCFP